MAFGINRTELTEWKNLVLQGEIAIITHYWYDKRFPQYETVTKVGCCNLSKLKQWGQKYELDPNWIDHHRKYPHFDLFGELQIAVLFNEKQFTQIKRFSLEHHLASEQVKLMNN